CARRAYSTNFTMDYW
nr:immunoglobulin heavy chain junction region [Mus musculus]